MNQNEIVNEILNDMVGIGGIPTNEEFYNEFNFRLKSKLEIKNNCTWKKVDMGMYGCNDYVWKTSCGVEYDVDKMSKHKFCPNCGNAII